MVYVRAGVQSVTVTVPTIFNSAAAQNLTFTAAIASTPTAATAMATIVYPTTLWVSAPIQWGGYARLKITADGKPKYSPYPYPDTVRPAGEVFRVSTNDGCYTLPEKGRFWPVPTLSGRSTFQFLESDIEGVAPAPGAPKPDGYSPPLTMTLQPCGLPVNRG
jgi:hypothetical protein